ncbi:MAG TPA: Fe2+-dependent dioxygenase [Chitinophagaceae bacterium]|nr:Fe2+-dependent dioxygenase [Chitinophagaceae bacterium]
MSQQFIQIPGLLKPAEVSAMEALIAKASFVDGKVTASLAARVVKNNLQVDANNKEVLEEVEKILNNALQQSPLFQMSAMPHHVYPYIISKYQPGRYYGWHVDSPVMGDPPMRTDLAMTIFLSDPESYTGGELVLQTNAGAVSFKPPKGDAVLYPCQYLHCVNEIKSGERLAAVTWVQSRIKSPEQRQILFHLSQVHALLNQRDMHAPETNLLLQSYSNLVRMWAEM